MSYSGHFKHSEETLIESASQFTSRSDWKKAKKLHYDSAWRRGMLDKCCAHMTPKAHPYSGSYIIYAYEFTDHHAYVDLTFTPTIRRSMHAQRGPVFDHLKTCATFTYKILEENIGNPQTAAEREKHWISFYQKEWTLLNTSRGGGLGTIHVTKWTREAIIAEAKKYPNKQAWINSSQVSYRIAKRENWFNEASAHMPKRVLDIGKGKKFTEDHRQKLSMAKLGKRQSKAHRRVQSKAIKAWWTKRNEQLPANHPVVHSTKP